MASNYNCGQFNDSFKPSRLKNWCHKTHPWQKCCDTQVQQFRPVGHLEFLADDRGHLLPCAKKGRKLKANWGQPVLRIWDESYGCGCYEPHLPKTSHPTWDEIPKHYTDGERPVVDCGPKQIQKPEVKVKSEFEKIREIRPPVIWIFGHVQKSLESLRKTFGKQLADHLGFTYLDLDQKIKHFAKYAPDAGSVTRHNSLPLEKFDMSKVTLNTQRASRLSKRLLEHSHSSLNIPGVLELIKMAMIDHWPTKGYVIEAFPCDIEEARAYEDMFWESAAGIYFTSSQWSEDKTDEPETISPIYFRRDETYSEHAVDAACDAYGYKTVKIIHAEEVLEEEVEYIDTVMDCFVANYPQTLAGQYDALTDKCKAMFLLPQEEIIEVFESSSDEEAEEEQEEEESEEEEEESEEDSEPEPEPEPEIEPETEPETEPEPETEDEPGLEEETEPELVSDGNEEDIVPLPPQIEMFNARKFSDPRKHLEKFKRVGTPGALAFPGQPKHAHKIADQVKNKEPASKPKKIVKDKPRKEIKLPTIIIPVDSKISLYKNPESSLMSAVPAEQVAKADDDNSTDSSGSSIKEAKLDAKKDRRPSVRRKSSEKPVDKRYFTPYTPEPKVDKDTVHSIFPAVSDRGPTATTLEQVKKDKLEAPKQTLQEKINKIFKPDNDWDKEDEEKKKTHVPLICCFDKKHHAAQYDRTKQAVDGYTEPAKETFGEKCKKFIHKAFESMKPKHEEIVPANVALENYYKEHPEEDTGMVAPPDKFLIDPHPHKEKTPPKVTPAVSLTTSTRAGLAARDAIVQKQSTYQGLLPTVESQMSGISARTIDREADAAVNRLAAKRIELPPVGHRGRHKAEVLSHGKHKHQAKV